ncbi:MAG: EAL domain-containing protein [Xanthomonadales bacterium]|nr:EAL domain-containing protein [Xanthomonadales bacterium]
MDHGAHLRQNTRSLAAEEILFREGESADCAYIIEEGRLEITTQSEGESVFICFLEAGEIVGEMGVIDSAPRTATAKAADPTRLTVVTREQLTERIAQADPILKLLVKILLDRYRSGLNTVKGESPISGDGELISEEVVGEYIHHGIDKIRLEAELKEALKQEQLEVFYQPLLDVQSRKVAGFEALTRWRHPSRGQISPGLFITLAEETSLIVPVGLFVFEQACKTLVEFQSQAGSPEIPIFMSINVSGRQIADPNFIDHAAEITSRYQLDRGQIKLEITESLAVDFELTERWIEHAHELGFQVSLDDFGTGYSSLHTLYRLDLDFAKIDQAFIKPLDDEPRSRELLRGIIRLMRGLGLRIVVEGVERGTQLDYVTELGCDYAQGFLVGYSLNSADALQLLEDGPDLETDAL